MHLKKLLKFKSSLMAYMNALKQNVGINPVDDLTTQEKD